MEDETNLELGLEDFFRTDEWEVTLVRSVKVELSL